MKDLIRISAIHLVRYGEIVAVLAEMDGKWVKVITEHDPDGRTPFSHIVEARGMRTCQVNQIS